MMLTWLFGFFAFGFFVLSAWLFDQWTKDRRELRYTSEYNQELRAELMTAQSELRITGNVLRAVQGQLRDYVAARTTMLEIYRNPN